MLFVSEEIRAQRMAICKACPHLTARNTCGTPVVGTWVEDNGRRVKTCGCFMDVKTRLKGFGCPLGKWSPYNLSIEEICAIQKLIQSIKGENTISNETARRIVDEVNKFSGRKVDYTTCSPCIRKHIEDLDKLTRDVYCAEC
jgi:hypothetical protein